MSGEMVNSFAAFFQDMWESDEVIIIPAKVKVSLLHLKLSYSLINFTPTTTECFVPLCSKIQWRTSRRCTRMFDFLFKWLT